MGTHGDALKVSVQTAPERGRANKQVLRVLAKTLGRRTADLEIVRGQTSRDKVVLFRGVGAAELSALLLPFQNNRP